MLKRGEGGVERGGVAEGFFLGAGEGGEPPSAGEFVGGEVEDGDFACCCWMPIDEGAGGGVRVGVDYGVFRSGFFSGGIGWRREGRELGRDEGGGERGAEVGVRFGNVRASFDGVESDGFAGGEVECGWNVGGGGEEGFDGGEERRHLGAGERY